LFAEQSSIGIARMHGAPVEALAGDIKSTLPIDNPLQELRGSDVMKAVKNGLRVVNGNAIAWMRAVSDHARTSDAILFAGYASPTAQAVARELAKPAIGLWLQPTSPTREFASPVLRPMKLPGWLNRLSYRASPQALIQRMYGKSTNAARKEIFGEATCGKLGHEGSILYGFSRHLVQRPGDWPDTHQICGHWALPSNDWQAPSNLLEFLSAGPPPIYIGFGAVSSFMRQRGLTEIAAAIAGRRALFYPGWSKITSAMLPKNFFVVDDIPHAWLFPRTSVVIHHCGAGTTHTAARAGVPSIGLPFGADQFFWAGRLASAGVAPKYIRGTKIDAQSLAKMIDFAARDDVRERAKALGAAMSEDNGVAYAVREIETQMTRMFASDRT
jgi:hypothetical protein